MKEIPLTQGRVALVDDADYEWLNQWKWSAGRGNSTFYAFRSISFPNGKKQMCRMHRVILGFQHKDGIWTDHINGNGLDNRRCNLRPCTNAQNQHNQQPRGKTSKFKGVRVTKNRWQVRIHVGMKEIYLGRFEDELDAAKAYDRAAIKYFGEFARLNFPREVYQNENCL